MSLKQEEINIFGIVFLVTGLSLTFERTSEQSCSSRWWPPPPQCRWSCEIFSIHYLKCWIWIFGHEAPAVCLLCVCHLKWQLCPEKTRWLCVLEGEKTSGGCEFTTTAPPCDEMSCLSLGWLGSGLNWPSGFYKRLISRLLFPPCASHLFR